MAFTEVSCCLFGFCMSLVATVSETYVHGACAPKVVSAKHFAVDSFSFDFVSPEFGNLRARSKTQMVDPGLGPTADVALIGECLSGAVGHDHEGNDKARKGGRWRGFARHNDVSSGESPPFGRPP